MIKNTFKLGLIAFIAILSSCQKTIGPIETIPVDSLAISYDTIQVFNELPSGVKESKRLGQSFPASDFTATGFYVAPSGTLSIYVDQLEDGTGLPTLLIGTYSRYKEKWNPTVVPLTQGLNTIQADQYGGLLYIRYNANDNSTRSGKARIEFRVGHKPVPHYILGKTTNAQWQVMLNTWTEAPDVLLESEETMLVASRAKALDHRLENQEQLMQTYDEIVKAEYAISGIDGSAAQHDENIHKILMTETDNADYFMVATWYRTAYYTSTMNTLLTVTGARNDGWGPWHELGHMHQQSAWTWEELGETTVNIYSLAAERKMGAQNSRLTRDNVWTEVMDYLIIPYAEKDFNASSTSVFARLAMFQQLWLAFGDTFYQTLHKETRIEQPNVTTRAQKMRYFMLKACTISGKNLSGFFRKWGLKVDESVYTEIQNLNLPTPTEDLTTKTDDPNWENKWLVIDYTNQETGAENGRAANIIDGNANTFWHSRWSSNPETYPYFITVDMKSSKTVSGFTLTQRNGSRKVREIEIQVSQNNTNWTNLGTFTLQENSVPQNIDLPSTQSFRYFKLVFKSAFDFTQNAAMAEVSVY
ncbi:MULTISPECIES: M60 family metallopeptidase [unclassified Sphingobacterium]|uniref:M60 family metallopeptidase n=1 Tax=unclassified Sphingobacterium TaxID=2609468 RepID=UPI0010498EF3|nr:MULTISPECIES: M60 family metallopeptidase [unclassified Sphingobacterium]MCS3552422.1 hypothetical protein [Sphingobacterium sp. JUb21]TCR10815.1 F5/8 type C domain-containing protein [Sphingobacterium sp. JUb20]